MYGIREESSQAVIKGSQDSRLLPIGSGDSQWFGVVGVTQKMERKSNRVFNSRRIPRPPRCPWLHAVLVADALLFLGEQPVASRTRSPDAGVIVTFDHTSWVVVPKAVHCTMVSLAL